MKKVLLLSVLLLAVLGVFTWRSLKITTDLEYFLPEGSGESHIESEVLHALSQSSLSRRIVLLVSAPDQRQAISAAKDLEAELAKLPVRVSSNAQVAQPLLAALFRHRYQFVSSTPEAELPRLLGKAGLLTAAAELKSALASPAGPMVRVGAVQDPLLVSRRVLERFARLNSSTLQLVDGVLLTEDGKHAVLFAASQAQAFDGQAQTQLWSQLEGAFARVRERAPGPVVIEASALSRYAAAAEQSMRADVTRVSLISSLAIWLLLWLVFVRLHYLPLLMLPLGAGFLVGTSTCLLVFGHIHAMTFAFGSALIGVCADYPIHLVNHLVLKDERRQASTKAVFVALLLGCVTTLFSFGAMGWGGLPGLREIATFGASGVLAAFLASMLWLPLVVKANQAVPARHLKIAEALHWGLTALMRRRVFGYWIVGLAGLVCAIGFPRVRWEDDPRQLTVLDPQVEAEDGRVRQAVLGQDGAEFVVLIFDGSEQKSLAANDRLAATLEAAVSEGALTGFTSLHNVIWSEELQARNLEGVKAHLTLEALREALEQEDFASEAFTPFGEKSADLALPALRIADLGKATYDTLVAPWFISLPSGRRGLLTRLSAVKDPVALRARISAIPGAHYMNVNEFRASAYALFRNRMLLLLSVGFVAIGLTLVGHYRRWRLAVCALVPAVLAAVFAAAVLALTGQSLNLMHVMGLLLVLGVGVDYGIFLVESLESKAWVGAAALSIAMAGASAVLSFGLLALSASPALRAVGQMISLGVVFSMVFTVAFATIFLGDTAGGRG